MCDTKVEVITEDNCDANHEEIVLVLTENSPLAQPGKKSLVENLSSAIHMAYDKQMKSSTMAAIHHIHTSITEFMIRTREPLVSSDLSNVYNDSVSVGKSVAKLSISLLVPAIKLIRGLGSGIAKAIQVPPINQEQPNSFG